MTSLEGMSSVYLGKLVVDLFPVMPVLAVLLLLLFARENKATD
jgi:hypothetical protein